MSLRLTQLTVQAHALTAAGKLVAARAVLDQALQAADADPRLPSPAAAAAAALHARVVITLGDPEAARWSAEFAYTAQEMLYGPTDERTVAAGATFAAVLNLLGDPAGATRLYHDVMDHLSRIDGYDSARVLAAQADLATAEHANGQCAIAQTRLFDAWQRHQIAFGRGAPASIRMLARLGAMERDCGRDTDAVRHLDEAQRLSRQHLGLDHPLTRQVAQLARAPADDRHADRHGGAAPGTGPDERGPLTVRQAGPPESDALAEPTAEIPALATAPPAGTPAASTPAASTPPASTPPADTPPAGTPPAAGTPAGPTEPGTPGTPTRPAAATPPRAATPPAASQTAAAATAAAPAAGSQAPAGPRPAAAAEALASGPPVKAIPEQRRRTGELVVRPTPPTGQRGRGRRVLRIAALLLGGGAAAVAIVVGLSAIDTPTGPSGRPAATASQPLGTPTPPPSGTQVAAPPPTATVSGPPAPTGVTISDNGGSVTLAWRYPAGAEGPVLISGSRVGQEQRAFQELPAGSESYVVYGLSERSDYCFTVAVVYSADSVAPAEQICTTRGSTPPN